MQTNYSPSAMKLHFDLLNKVNPELPDVITKTLIDVLLSELTRADCTFRVVGRTLRTIGKITDDELQEFSVDKYEKAFVIIAKVDVGLLTILKLNILDMLSCDNYASYEIAIHIMLDILYYLSYITQDEFEKAYNAGGKDGE